MSCNCSNIAGLAGLSGIITTSMLNLYTEGETEMFRALSIPCRIEYIPVKTACPNCIANPLTGASSGKYKTGGPYPFTIGMCPYCNGAGFKETATTEAISFQVGWKVKDFLDIFKTNAVLDSPDSYVQIKGLLSDLPKFNKMNVVVINLPWEPSIRYTFKKKSEAIPSGIRQNKYFYMLLERV